MGLALSLAPTRTLTLPARELESDMGSAELAPRSCLVRVRVTG